MIESALAILAVLLLVPATANADTATIAPNGESMTGSWNYNHVSGCLNRTSLVWQIVDEDIDAPSETGCASGLVSQEYMQWSTMFGGSATIRFELQDAPGGLSSLTDVDLRWRARHAAGSGTVGAGLFLADGTAVIPMTPVATGLSYANQSVTANGLSYGPAAVDGMYVLVTASTVGQHTPRVSAVNVDLTFNAAPNNPPDPPQLALPDAGALTADDTPQLSATFEDPDAGDTGNVHFEVCDLPTSAGQDCVGAGGSVLASGVSAGGLSIGEAGMWTPGALGDGVVYWHAYGEDQDTAISSWTATRMLEIDTGLPAATLVPNGPANLPGPWDRLTWTGSCTSIGPVPVTTLDEDVDTPEDGLCAAGAGTDSGARISGIDTTTVLDLTDGPVSSGTITDVDFRMRARTVGGIIGGGVELELRDSDGTVITSSGLLLPTNIWSSFSVLRIGVGVSAAELAGAQLHVKYTQSGDPLLIDAINLDIRYSAAPSDPYSTTVLSHSPVGYWKLGEGAGATAFDSSGNNHDGTYVGGVTYSQPGALTGDADTAVGLDGTADHVWIGDVPDLRPSAEVAVEGWFKTNGGGPSYQMIYRHRWNGYAIAVMNTGVVRTRIYLDNGVVTAYNADSPLAYDDGQWHHAVGVYDGSGIHTYVDGQLVKSTPTAGGVISYGPGGGAIGRDGDSNGLYFPGDVDEVAVYASALTSDEIEQHWLDGEYHQPPDAQWTDDTDASVVGANPNPIDITEDDFHLSWTNNAVGTVDRHRIEVVNTPLDGVVGLWHFDDQADPSADESASALPADLGNAGAAPSYVDHLPDFGKSLSFGGNDNVRIAHSGELSLSEYTVEAWFKASSIAAQPYPNLLMKQAGTNSRNYGIWFDRDLGLIAGGFSSGGANQVVTAPGNVYVDDTWHHVAMTVDAGLQQRLYVDGIEVDSRVAAGAPDLQPDDLYIGNNNGGDPFTGQIDDVRVVSRALSADEIRGYVATARPHHSLMWDSDGVADDGEPLGADCASLARCDDLVYGTSGPQELELRYDDARYYARAKLMGKADGSWSQWSTWDWFETDATTGLDMSGCLSGVADVTDFGPVVPTIPQSTADDCTIGFGASGASTELRMYQADGGGDPAWTMPSGSTLSTFGNNGVLTVDPTGGDDRGRDSVVQPDGHVVVTATDGNDDVWIARFDEDGNPDGSFAGGSVVVDVAGADQVHGIELAADGDILVAGRGDLGSGIGFVVRYNADGTPDAAWGTSGVATVDTGAGETFLRDTHELDDGSIIATGSYLAADRDMLLVKFTRSGIPDTDWAPGGFVGHDIAARDEIWRSVLHQGQIVAGGRSRAAAQDRMFVARFELDGSLDDTGFGAPDGWVILDPSTGDDSIDGLVVQDDGRIIASGESFVGASDFEFATYRLMPDGTLDGDWNGTGLRREDLSAGVDRPNDGWLQPDGKYLVIGETSNGTHQRFAAVRYLDDGTPDSSFGSGGVVLIDPPAGTNLVGEGLHPGVDGRAVITGTLQNAGDREIAVAMLETSTLSNYDDSGGMDWQTGGANAFGACLRRVSSGAQEDPPDTWTEAPSNSCLMVDDSRWNPIPIGGSDPLAVVAGTSGPGVAGAVVDIRFGARLPTGIDAGTTYHAPIIVEAVSPDL